MKRRVEITRWRGPTTTAECEQCDLIPDATRERVRQHVMHSGHTVRVIVEDITRYEPGEPS